MKKPSMKFVTLYTDGACSGNPGPGGWAAILIYNGHERVLSGGKPSTTNNRMEMTALIKALIALKEPCTVDWYCDSQYVVDALVRGWAIRWKKYGWMRKDHKPAANADLWEMILILIGRHIVRCHWLRGHAGNEYNERCDAIAVAESRKFAAP